MTDITVDQPIQTHNSIIEEIWIIRDNVCIFHECWSEKPIDLDIQMFSAFTSAVNSFSKTTLQSEQLRNIDFQNTTFVLEPLAEYGILFVIKFSPISEEKQLEVMNSILSEIKSFILDFELNELFSVQSSNIPLTAYRLPLSKFFQNFMLIMNQNEKEIRKIDLLSIIQLAESLYSRIVKSKAQNTLLEPLNSDNIFNNLLNNHTSTILSTDSLPTLSRGELKHQFHDFVVAIKLILRKNLSLELQNEVLRFFTTNYKLIKTYDLDEAIVENILAVFSEEPILSN